MKKLFTLMMLAIAVMTAKATDYTDRLLVLVNGEGGEQQATISVTKNGNLYDLNLKNFMLINGNTQLPVGNVELKGITPEQSGNAIFLRAKQDITVSAGDTPGVSSWLGPNLGELPVDLTAVLENGKLRALIDLEVKLLEQIVNVRFGEELVAGTNYHIPNGGFEEWHTSGIYEEPNAWHSFESATGDFASFAGNHIEKLEEGGINGTSCARIFATSLFGIVANGTMTTGRMNAGNMSATSTQNNAYLDMSMTDTDGNGDPFYVTLTNKPDSLVLWVNFKQGKTNKEHPYATVSAVITDGTYYQDPEDKSYSNYMAKAKNNEIAVTKGKWQRISIPFTYFRNNVEPKAILVTISTNADPGQGSEGDEVLVDDISLVYNSKLSKLNVPGFNPEVFEYETDGSLSFNSIEATADGWGCHVLKSLEQKEDGEYAVIKVYSADLRSSNTYTIKLNSNGSTSIISIPTSTASSADTYYNIDGTQVTSPQKGRVVIVRKADGSTMKVVR